MTRPPRCPSPNCHVRFDGGAYVLADDLMIVDTVEDRRGAKLERQRDRGGVSEAIFATRGELRGPPPSDPEAGPRPPFPTDQLRGTVLYDEPRVVDRRPRAGACGRLTACRRRRCRTAPW
ncbi:hypothetical protein [Streptomyces antimycoticus]|uniref:hypothetical protein n=1 Tax=Streptomyces antimycoticus TaxID=68175 RepID=UPI0010F9404E|nr:hypothetical protein [Streptomyces antimycoticus]